MRTSLGQFKPTLGQIPVPLALIPVPPALIPVPLTRNPVPLARNPVPPALLKRGSGPWPDFEWKVVMVIEAQSTCQNTPPSTAPLHLPLCGAPWTDGTHGPNNSALKLLEVLLVHAVGTVVPCEATAYPGRGIAETSVGTIDVAPISWLQQKTEEKNTKPEACAPGGQSG